MNIIADGLTCTQRSTHTAKARGSEWGYTWRASKDPRALISWTTLLTVAMLNVGGETCTRHIILLSLRTYTTHQEPKDHACSSSSSSTSSSTSTAPHSSSGHLNKSRKSASTYIQYISRKKSCFDCLGRAFFFYPNHTKCKKMMERKIQSWNKTNKQQGQNNTNIEPVPILTTTVLPYSKNLKHPQQPGRSVFVFKSLHQMSPPPPPRSHPTTTPHPYEIRKKNRNKASTKNIRSTNNQDVTPPTPSSSPQQTLMLSTWAFAPRTATAAAATVLWQGRSICLFDFFLRIYSSFLSPLSCS